MSRRVRLFFLIVAILAAVPLAVADDTQNLLEAKRVNDYLQFRIRKVKDGVAVEYRADPLNGGFKTLRDDFTFVAPDEIDLGYYKFNPFEVSISSTETIAEDPNAKAIDDFGKALISTAKGFAPSLTGGADEGVSAPEDAATDSERLTSDDCKELDKDCLNNAIQAAAEASFNVQQTNPCNLKDKKKRTTCISTRTANMLAAYNATLDARMKTCAERRTSCDRCAKLIGDAEKLHAAVGALETIPGKNELRRWVAKAIGRKGIREVKEDLEARAESMGKDIETAEAVRQSVEDLKITAGIVHCGDFKDFKANPDALAKQISADAAKLDKLLPRHQKLVESMADAIKALAAYDLADWRGDENDPQDLIFRKSTSDADKINNIAVTFKLTTYSFDEKNSVFTSKVEGEATRKLALRQFRSFVPEVGMAVVYNELEYPKYSVADGTVAVKTAETNVNAALTLNFLTNPLGGRFAYPGFQLGVSKVDDYPGILGGVVIRFARPEKISIGIGGVLTWYKELKDIKVGDPIASQDELDKKLRRRTKNGWYVAVQYTF